MRRRPSVGDHLRALVTILPGMGEGPRQVSGPRPRWLDCCGKRRPLAPFGDARVVVARGLGPRGPGVRDPGFLAPVLLVPLFYRFRPLADAALRRRFEALPPMTKVPILRLAQ